MGSALVLTCLIGALVYGGYIAYQMRILSSASLDAVQAWSDFDSARLKRSVSLIETASAQLHRMLVPVKPFAGFVGYARDINDTVVLTEDIRQVSAEALVWIDMWQRYEQLGSSLSDISLASISSYEGDTLRALVAQGVQRLPRTQRVVDKASQNASDIMPRLFHGRFLPLWDRFDDEIAHTFHTLTSALDTAYVVGSMAGFVGGDKTYLLILQNPAELRPSGGFIGNYGTLSVSRGSITSLSTRDVYDMPPSVVPIASRVPDPLKQYLGTSTWYFRDANWSPDWSTTAQTLLQLYEPASHESAPRFDGVIGITPQAFGRVLAIMGPLDAQGVRVDAQSLTETLLNEVGREFENKGIPYEQRKAIINQLLQEFVVKFSRVPLREYRDFWKPIQESLEKKDIQIMSIEALVQDRVRKLGWGGVVAYSGRDALMVVDANMASLKTDPFVDRATQYEVVPRKDGRLVARLTLTYKNNARFTWKTTRYRSYTRVYMPVGSTLVSVTGNQKRDRSQEPGTVQEGVDLGMHVVGFFISVEPQSSHKVVLEYVLPPEIQSRTYSLNVLHQAGVGTRGLTLRFGFDTSGGTWAYSQDVKPVYNSNFFALSGDAGKDIIVTYDNDGAKNSN